MYSRIVLLFACLCLTISVNGFLKQSRFTVSVIRSDSSLKAEAAGKAAGNKKVDKKAERKAMIEAAAGKATGNKSNFKDAMEKAENKGKASAK